MEFIQKEDYINVLGNIGILLIILFVYLMIAYIMYYKKIKELKKIYNTRSYFGLLKPAYKVWKGKIKSKTILVISTIVLVLIMIMGLLFPYMENNTSVYVDGIAYGGSTSGIVVAVGMVGVLIWIYLIAPIQILYNEHFPKEEKK